jgi:hypothetical protein
MAAWFVPRRLWSEEVGMRRQVQRETVERADSIGHLEEADSASAKRIVVGGGIPADSNTA